MQQAENPTQFARRQRRKSTLAERVMWILLRRRELGRYKFRRQHPIGIYTVDFVCVHKHLIVECDGVSHLGKATYDQHRDAFLQEGGFQALRFTDDAVHGNPDRVAQQILACLQDL